VCARARWNCVTSDVVQQWISGGKDYYYYYYHHHHPSIIIIIIIIIIAYVLDFVHCVSAVS
jgi:hypothetical protein